MISRIYRIRQVKRFMYCLDCYLATLQLIKEKLSKTFITLEFKYCLVTWMCDNGGVNNRTNHLSKRVLRIVYQHEKFDFSTLFENASVSIRVKT